MAKKVVVERGMPIKWARQALNIIETCYHYVAKLNSENDVIADWLVRITENNRTWGFGFISISAILKKLAGITSVFIGFISCRS